MKCTECNGRGVATYYVEIHRDEKAVIRSAREDVCHTCNGSGKKPVTNADCIRSMSDEELIKFFGHDSLCSYIQDNDKKWCDKRLACGNCLARWLQQPAKERE